ncbi:hypothetical protein [Thermomonospora cellulosilytica]|uniref:Uncharacterized protein n=1 Tax=Thermomonospora cellulosilytica TaxID=1411118 RepID=A0A7W3MV21_9ACTN|nr:hypothetical protein [Thermomonospora cellulosilytica]MBA9002472.1 hypothetical protein [Thermomonospora cellulosilytica]
MRVRRRVRLLGAAAVLGLAATVMSGLTQPPPASAATGLQIVTADSASDYTDSKGAYAFCPTGKRVIGGGGIVRNAGSNAAIRMLRPEPGSLRDAFVAAASETTSYNGNWSVTAIAVCADPLPGLEHVYSESSRDSSAFKSNIATCPAGKKVIGTGGWVGNDRGRVVLDEIIPATNLQTVRAGAYEAEGGNPDVWWLGTWAVCADPMPGLTLITKTGTQSTAQSKAIFADCPAGTKVHAVGGDVHGGNGQVVLNSLYPQTGLTSAMLQARVDPTGYTGLWQTRIFAICAPEA